MIWRRRLHSATATASDTALFTEVVLAVEQDQTEMLDDRLAGGLQLNQGTAPSLTCNGPECAHGSADRDEDLQRSTVSRLRV